MNLHLPTSGTTDRSLPLAPATVEITGSRSDGSTFVETVNVRSSGGLPSDPAWFRERPAAHLPTAWQRAAAAVSRRLAR